MLRNTFALLALPLFLLLAGCGGSTSTVSSTPPPVTTQAQAVLSPSAITFPATIAGSTAAAIGVTLSNPGTAALTGIAITLGGTNASNFAETTTCSATLAIGSTCSISATFTPAAATNYAATISVVSSATTTAQTIALSGSGNPVPGSPAVTLSAATMAFGTVTVGNTAPSSVTMTNSGTASLTISSIALSGTNQANFAETTTCGSSLAATASCTITAAFTPAAASSYTATITITDNATGSPQTIALTGTGMAASTSITHTLLVFPATFPENLPDANVTQLYNFINSAIKTIDMTMYELQDTTFSGYLAAACAKGVKVRVVLDASLVKSNNTPAYNQLNTAGANCSANFSNTAFQATHQKTITVDNTTTAIMSLNLQTQYYTTTRDFALFTNDPSDVAAIETTFAQDYAAGTPYNGTQGASDLSYTPPTGDDLIWSPTTAQTAMLALINNATTTILLENEEMGAANIVSALEAACQRGVTVHIAMVNSSTSSPYSSYATNFKALEAAGCGVRTYPDTATGLYIHAKAVVADYGLSTQKVYMGSINYSIASMTENRELGVYITDSTAVTLLETTMTNDYAGATAF